jgi:uncharacterized membrane protein YukC
MTQHNTEEIGASKESKVFQLCQELESVRVNKKISAKAFNEEIKRINAEIKELLLPEQEELP